MSIDSVTLERLRELAEASKAGGWQEVLAALDMGDIVVRIRDDGDRGVVKAAQEATGLGRSTLWRRAKLAEHRELIETQRPTNLSEALKLIKGATAAAEEGQGQTKDKGGRPPVPAVEKLTKQLKGAVWGLAEGSFLTLEEVMEEVRGAYAGGAEARANAAPAAPPDQERDGLVGLVAQVMQRERARTTPPPPADSFKDETAVQPGDAPETPAAKSKAKRGPLALVRLDMNDGSGRVTFSDGRAGLAALFRDGSLCVTINNRSYTSGFFETWRLVKAELDRRAAAEPAIGATPETSPDSEADAEPGSAYGFSGETLPAPTKKRGGPRKPASADSAIEVRRERQRQVYQAKRTAPKGDAPAELRKKPGPKPKAKPANDGWRVSQTMKFDRHRASDRHALGRGEVLADLVGRVLAEHDVLDVDDLGPAASLDTGRRKS